MKLKFLWVGKTRKAPFRDLIADYLDRVARFARVEVIEVRDRNDVGGDPKTIIEREGDDILARIEGDPYVIVLDERGAQFDSAALAELISEQQLSGTKQITFILGSHGGLSETVKRNAHLALSLSKLTLPHELSRLVIVEQIYRAFSIINDLPYHK